MNPGIAAIRKTRRSRSLSSATSARPSSGPSTAPAVSIDRCSPNARPLISGAVESAIRASRGLPRTPLPNRSTNLAISTTGQTVAIARMSFPQAPNP